MDAPPSRTNAILEAVLDEGGMIGCVKTEKEDGDATKKICAGFTTGRFRVLPGNVKKVEWYVYLTFVPIVNLQN